VDSNSRKKHRHAKHRVGGSFRGEGRSRSKLRRSSTQASSSFAAVSIAPSRAPVSVAVAKEAAAVCKSFIWGLLGVCVLILLGGGHNVYALGFALILPGVALLLRPPRRSLGKWLDVGVFGLLGSLLLAFVPMFYWKAPAWRTTAVDVFGLEFSWSLSVQPWISFEAFLLAVAGFSWLYAASSWEVNHSGRKRIYFWLSCLIAVFAVVVLVGNLFGWRYPGAESATAFSFFPNRNQTINFIAIGGVLTFGYAIEGLRRRKLIQMVGFVGSFSCLAALVSGVSGAGVLLYFGGIFLWFIFSLRRSAMSLFLKVGIPVLLLLVFSFFITSHGPAMERATKYLSPPSEWGQSDRLLIFQDAVDMIQDAPLAGHGLGNFEGVFPQYRDLSRNYQRAVDPGSDLFLLGAEGGLIAVCFLAIFLVSYFRKCRTSGAGRSGAFRMIALTGVILFLVHGLFDVSGHRPGTAYFAILFMVLALPRATADVRPTFKPVIWRSVGGGLLLFGGLWMLGGLFGLPTHSSVALDVQGQRAVQSRAVADVDRASRAVDAMITLQPLNWRGYFQRAQLGLSRGGARSEVAQDFRRARFVEPNIALVAYKEGCEWLPYDVTRAVSAWGEALIRDTDSKDRLYAAMLSQASKNVWLMEGMIEMSQVYPYYRACLLLSLHGEAFNREIEQELRADASLGRFAKEQRTAILRHWIDSAGSDQVEAYLDAYGDTLDSPWLLYAMLRHNQSQYEEAVEMMRLGLPVQEIPEVDIDRSRMDRLKRGFFAASNDLLKGTALMSIYLENDEYLEALEVVNKLLKQPKLPRYVYYWRAEILYQLGDYSESWYAFQDYWKQVQ
jgi:O-antigen ligase/tetratricopeptide (TPR) repeat protein